MSTSQIGICLWPCIGFCTESCNSEKYILLGLLFLGVFNLLVSYVILRGRTRTPATSLNQPIFFWNVWKVGVCFHTFLMYGLG